MKTPRRFICLSALAGLLFLILKTKKEDSTPAPAPTQASPTRSPTVEPPPSPTSDRAADLVASGDPHTEIALEFPPNARTNELILHFDDTESYTEYLKALREAGKAPLDRIDALRTLRIPTHALAAINPGTYASRGSFSYIVQPPSPVDSDTRLDLSSLRGFGETARTITQGGAGLGSGSGVLVAVIDSGILNHSSFQNVDRSTLNLSAEGNTSPSSSHGTSVASIITGTDGIAPQASLLDINIFNTENQASSFDVARGIIEAVDQGADLINMSIGVYQDTEILREAVQYAADRGVLMVAAAGNDAVATLPYPAAYDAVIAVTAIDALDQHAVFSNQSYQIDYAAPGVSIAAASENDAYTSFTGTSASTAFITGTLAAAMSGEQPRTPQAALNLLNAHTNEAGAPGTDALFGTGILDWDRLSNHQQPGVVDLALASIYVPADSIPGTLAPVEITVQNQGTQWIEGATLEIKIGEAESRFVSVGSLTSGATATHSVLTLIPSSDADTALPISARVLHPSEAADSRTENNTSSILLRPPPTQP